MRSRRGTGCGVRFTDAHHIRHWADGGETTLRNLVLLCRRHHRRVHEEGHRVILDRRGQVVFFTPTGKPIFEVPPQPTGPRSEAWVLPNQSAVEDSARAAGEAESPKVSDWTAWSLAPGWKRDADIPWTIEGAAVEAVVGGRPPGL